jgi:hypothetical protein
LDAESWKIRIGRRHKCFQAARDRLTFVLTRCTGVVFADFRTTLGVQSIYVGERCSNECQHLAGILVLFEMALIRSPQAFSTAMPEEYSSVNCLDQVCNTPAILKRDIVLITGRWSVNVIVSPSTSKRTIASRLVLSQLSCLPALISAAADSSRRSSRMRETLLSYVTW